MRLRLHATRLTAGLLGFALGNASAGLRPVPKQDTPPPAPPPAAYREPPPAATVTVSDTAPAVRPRVTQKLVTSFPGLGMVWVRAVENYGERMRIEVLSVETDALLYSFEDPTDERPGAGSISNPFLRFRILRIEGLPQPLIFAVTVTPGGSGHGFYAMLIGEVGGRLKVLTEEPLGTSNQGGIYVGDLGAGRGFGAAVWETTWDYDSECHYCPHRYEVALYPFDSRRKRFVKGRVLKSQRQYGGHGDGALGELRLRYTDLLQDMPDVSDYHWL